MSKGYMLVKVDGEKGGTQFPIATIEDTAKDVYEAYKERFDRNGVDYDKLVNTLWYEEIYMDMKHADDIYVIVSEYGKVYMRAQWNDSEVEGYWELDSGVIVKQVPLEGDMYMFEVYYKGRMHTVVPSDAEDMNDCINELNAGADPLFDGWNDGLGYNLQEVLIYGQEVV